MRVNDVYLTNVKLEQPERTRGAGSPGATAAAAGEAQATEASTHTPSPELLQLLAQVRQQPAVRQDRLEAVARRLAAGDYNTREAARQTAEAMLNAPD